MAQSYKNIPVKPETYKRVALIAKMRGGIGLGAQVDEWVKQELPHCEHRGLSVVSIQIESQFLGKGESGMRSGLYCPKCNRVYVKEFASLLPKSQPISSFNPDDPYVPVIESDKAGNIKVK